MTLFFNEKNRARSARRKKLKVHQLFWDLDFNTAAIHFWWGQKRTFPKAFLALSRDVGTVRVHRDSTALCRCKSGTGPRPCITSASSSIVVVIAALDYIMCSLSRDNDDAHEDFCATSRRCGRKQQKDDRWRHSSPM